MDVRGTAYFAANDGVTGVELWKSDGTAGGTVLVEDFNPGPDSSYVLPAVFTGTHLLMTARSPGIGVELWALAANRPPRADAGPDQTVEADAAVSLDGSGSSDPDGEALSYTWTDEQGHVIGQTAVVALGTLPVGVHDFTLVVRDGSLAAQDDVRIEVLAPPSLSIDDVAGPEGNRLITTQTFHVVLSRAIAHPVTVQFATVAGTARTWLDYWPTSGTVTLPAGTTNASVSVIVWGDRQCERDDTFFVDLLAPAGATLGRVRGQGTIVDDDCAQHL
jgi:ELWxxDGT repeat protein